jgi:hypothetical protein
MLPMVKAVEPLLPRRDVALGVLPYYHIFGSCHHCHITGIFAHTLRRCRYARVISPLLRLPRGHRAQI